MYKKPELEKIDSGKAVTDALADEHTAKKIMLFMTVKA
jgi:hypothetical protein